MYDKQFIIFSDEELKKLLDGEMVVTDDYDKTIYVSEAGYKKFNDFWEDE